MEESRSASLTPGERRRLQEEAEFEAAALERKRSGRPPVAFESDGTPVAEFEVAHDESPPKPRDEYLGDRIET